MYGRHSSLRRRLARLVFTLLMTIAWCGGVPHLMRGATARAQPAVAAPAPQPADPAAVAALLKRICAAAEQELRKPGANPSDVPAKAAELGYDTARAFAFVRNDVAYEPYRGQLRGPRGALAAHAGNALDKALLLKALLEAGGQEARLMRGQLAPEKARALAEQYLKTPPAPEPARGGAEALPISPALAEQIGVTLPDIQEMLAEGRRTADRFLADATSGADVEAKFLRERLDAAGLKAGRTHAQWVDELAARAGDHYWLELPAAGGAATVLDPVLGDSSRAGEPAAAAAEGQAVKDLAAERHLVRFQFVYKTLPGDAPADQVLLDVPLYADEALYDPPMFTIEPTDPLPAPSKIMEMEPDAAIRLLTGFKNYQAVLRTGGKRTASPAFDLKGNVTPVGGDGRVRGAQQLGGATGGLFGGGALGGGGDGGRQQANNFVEMGVVMTIQSPGAPPQTQRRVLLTRTQTTGAEFLSPILEWKLLIQPQRLTAELAGFEGLASTLDALRPILPVLGSKDGGDEILDRAARTQPSPHSELLTTLSGYRQAATEAALRENQSVAALWDRPQVAVAEQRFCANAKEGRTCGHSSIDVVENSLSYIPRTPEAADAAARCALRQGVFDTVAEALLLARQPGAVAPASAIDELRAAREAGAPVTVAAPGDAAALASTVLSEADRGWIAANEPATRRVAARAAGGAGGGASAWWSIDVQTGCVLGRRQGGRGQSMSEYVVQVATGGICMIVNAVNAQRDISTSGGKKRKFGGGYYLAQLGCIIGGGIGVAGVGRAVGMQSALTLLNAVIGGGISILGAEISRD
jgi:hypothetical protein